MMTDSEIKSRGFELLVRYPGNIEAERFIALIQREPFDYTEWRQHIEEGTSLAEVSQRAMMQRNKRSEQGV